MISDVDIFKQAYADGYNAGYEQACYRAESRVELGLPLVVMGENEPSDVLNLGTINGVPIVAVPAD